MNGCLSGGNIDLFQPAMASMMIAWARSAFLPCCFIRGSAIWRMTADILALVFGRGNLCFRSQSRQPFPSFRVFD